MRLINALLIFCLTGGGIQIANSATFHEQCNRVTEDPVLMYYSLNTLSGIEKLNAIKKENETLTQLQKEIVTDSISQLVWTFVWRPYAQALILALNSEDIPYADIKKELMNECFKLSDQNAALAKNLARSQRFFLPTQNLAIELQKSAGRPILISPFDDGWIDSNGGIYRAQGSSFVGPNGEKIQKFSNYLLSNSGQMYAPFGNGYINPESVHTIRQFGFGFIDSNGRTLMPFGKGWIYRR